MTQPKLHSAQHVFLCCCAPLPPSLPGAPPCQPLQEATDPETGRRYLQCEYNRDASSYRSPWSNKYDPPIEDGFTPGDRLRRMEVRIYARQTREQKGHL